MHTAFLTDTILDKKLEDLRFGRKSKLRSLMRGHLVRDLGAISRWPLLEGAIEGHPGAPCGVRVARISYCLLADTAEAS